MSVSYSVFGDESAGPKGSAYGLAVLRNEMVEVALAILREEKGRFGDPDAKLHCREIFNGSRRLKSDWSHLSLDDCFELYGAIVDRLGLSGMHFVAGAALRRDVIDAIPSLTLRHKDPENTSTVESEEFPLAEKQLGIFCAQAALTTLVHNGIENFSFWADSDRTSMKWLRGNRKASNALETLFIGRGEREPLKVVVEAADPRLVPLFDVADLVAYSNVKRMHPSSSTSDLGFRKLSKRLGAVVARVAMKQEPNGFNGLGFSIPHHRFSR